MPDEGVFADEVLPLIFQIIMFRSQLFIGIVASSLFMLIAYSSCIKDKCGNITCFNNGICVEGFCTCPSVYEGPSCQTEWQEKYAGNWQARDLDFRDSTKTYRNYALSLKGSVDSFLINGLGDTLRNVVCKYSSRYSFNIKGGQAFGDSITIQSGRGTITNDGKKVTGLYSFTHKDTSITTSFTWTR